MKAISMKTILTLALISMMLTVGTGAAFATEPTWTGIDKSTISSSASYTQRITSSLSLNVGENARWNNWFTNSKSEPVTAEVVSAPSDGTGNVFSTTYGSIPAYTTKQDFYAIQGPLSKRGSFSLGVVHWYYWGNGQYTNTGTNGQPYTAA